MYKTKYMLSHWKFIIHLLLKTKYFGVNNQWKSLFPSTIGLSTIQIFISVISIYPIIQNYQAMKMRSMSGWVEKEKANQLFK